MKKDKETTVLLLFVCGLMCLFLGLWLPFFLLTGVLVYTIIKT